MSRRTFASDLIAWQLESGRHHLPWQVKDPYRRWISEIMLQQTQVSVVVDYFSRFMERFPTLSALCDAHEEDVLKLWAGLGYYTRARNIWRCAQKLKTDFHREFPKTVEELTTLPGIGLSTAGAIASFAFDVPAPILDGNVKRVFTRIEAIVSPINKAATEKQLWSMAYSLVPRKDTGIYNQALMDLGATVCTKTKPKCNLCPVAAYCKAHQSKTEETFPVKIKPKAKPTQSTCMTVFYSGRSVWLVHREKKGVWQGLWSLPENLDSIGSPLTTFTHVFSHYKLNASVQLVKATESQKPTPDGRWVSLEEIASEALPAPIKKVLLANFTLQ